MFKNFVFSAATIFLIATPAFADPITANWKRPNGIIVKFAPCGTAFCATAVTGPHAGGSAGKLSPNGKGGYAGTLTDLENGKTYNGKGSISGTTLTVSGCILGGLLCRSESWIKQ